MWTPSIPVIMYHGTKKDREEIFQTKMMRNLKSGRPTDKFPVVCTSYEMVLRDQANLSKISWEFIIIVRSSLLIAHTAYSLINLQDEGHRMKNSDSKLFQHLRQFSSATRLLITGTPLQNNLKELWSLLHFLLPTIFTDWDAFESWFDFSDLEDEQGTEEFIGNEMKKDLVKKIHLILQPLLLRRIKQDVAAYLPKKREYVLFAPMSLEQTDLYNALSDKNVDPRQYLENRAVEAITSLTASRKSSRGSSNSSNAANTHKTGVGKGSTMALPLRESPRKKSAEKQASSSATNAFAMMMGKRGSVKKQPVAEETPRKPSPKRKEPPTSAASQAKSSRSSRQSTPASTRGRSRKSRTYKEADSDEERLSDDEFEAKLADELVSSDNEEENSVEYVSTEEMERAQTLELASMSTAAHLETYLLTDCRETNRSEEAGQSPSAITTGVQFTA